MKKISFPKSAERRPSPLRNINNMYDEQLSMGQRTADWVANTMGSWRFIIVQTAILTFWIALNVTAYLNHWDPYPFILMNLILSTQAAYAAPIIMMSQNRQAARDRLEAHNDFLVNQKAEEEVREILAHLEAQNTALQEIYHLLAQVPPANPENRSSDDPDSILSRPQGS